MMLALYAWWPWRPRCSVKGSHVLLCRLARPWVPAAKKCPDAPDIPVPNPLPRR